MKHPQTMKATSIRSESQKCQDRKKDEASSDDGSYVYKIWKPKMPRSKEGWSILRHYVYKIQSSIRFFRPRDVMFNEDEIYERKEESPEMVSTEPWELTSTIEEPDETPKISHDFKIVFNFWWGHGWVRIYRRRCRKFWEKAFENSEVHLTLKSIPPAALMIGTICGECENQCDVITPRFELWKTSLCAGYRKTAAQNLPKRQRIRTIPHEKSINKARIQRLSGRLMDWKSSIDKNCPQNQLGTRI